jgi:glycosyltransferase involved in cell wall biosynthesis
VIIIEDGSDDDTPEILQHLQVLYGKDWVELICLPVNCGPGAARNVGWDMSTEPYVAFLDADDTWHPRKIEIQVGLMEAYPELALTGHRWRWLPAGIVAYDALPDTIRMSILSARRLLLSNSLITSTVMVRRTLPFRFDPSKRYSEDYLLWLEIVLSGLEAAFINAKLAYLHKPPFGAHGLSGQLWAMEVGELDTYCRLWRRGRIATATFLAVVCFSIVKFGRRMFRSALWKLRMAGCPGERAITDSTC